MSGRQRLEEDRRRRGCRPWRDQGHPCHRPVCQALPECHVPVTGRCQTGADGRRGACRSTAPIAQPEAANTTVIITISIREKYLSVMRSEGPALMPIFRSRHQAGLLAWLLLHPDQEYTVAELAKRLDVPVPTLHREVQRLVDAGLLEARTIGRSRLLRANTDNRATAPLTQLLELTFGPHVVVAEEWRRLRCRRPGPSPARLAGQPAGAHAGQVEREWRRPDQAGQDLPDRDGHSCATGSVMTVGVAAKQRLTNFSATGSYKRSLASPQTADPPRRSSPLATRTRGFARTFGDKLGSGQRPSPLRLSAILGVDEQRSAAPAPAPHRGAGHNSARGIGCHRGSSGQHRYHGQHPVATYNASPWAHAHGATASVGARDAGRRRARRPPCATARTCVMSGSAPFTHRYRAVWQRKWRSGAEAAHWSDRFSCQ
jgi:DNA-binding transcriptional ArsR family regulator